MSNSAAELDHSRNELVLVATRDIQCAAPPPQGQGHREHVHLWFVLSLAVGNLNDMAWAQETPAPVSSTIDVVCVIWDQESRYLWVEAMHALLCEPALAWDDRAQHSPVTRR